MTLLWATGFDIVPHEWVPVTWDRAATGYSGGINCTVQTTTKKTGGAALKLDGVTTASDAHVAAVSNTWYNEIFFHFNFLVDAIIAQGSPVGAFQSLFAASAGSYNPGVAPQWFYLDLLNDGGGGGGTNILRLNVQHKTFANSPTFGPINANQWYSVQLRFYCPQGEPTPTQPRDYLVEVKLDDVIIFSTWAVMDASASDYKLAPYFGQVWVSTIALPACNAFIDDFMASAKLGGSYNEGWPGNALAIYGLTPDGTGVSLAYDAWVVSPTWSKVNESPEAVANARSGTLNDKVGWTMTTQASLTNIRGLTHNLSTAVSGPTKSARAGIKALIYDSAEVASAEFNNLVSSATNFGNAASKRGQQIAVYERQPTGGAAWNQTTIDGMEIGMQLTTFVSGVNDVPLVFDARVYVVTGAEGPASGMEVPPRLQPALISLSGGII